MYANFTKSEKNQFGPISMFIVLTNSMVPIFNEGDAIFVINTNPENLYPGDIITFYAFDESRTIITHRITSKEFSENEGYLFSTKGDANLSEDNFKVPTKDIIGKYFYKIDNVSEFMFRIREKPYEVFIIAAVFLLLDFVIRSLKKYFSPHRKNMNSIDSKN